MFKVKIITLTLFYFNPPEADFVTLALLTLLTLTLSHFNPPEADFVTLSLINLVYFNLVSL